MSNLGSLLVKLLVEDGFHVPESGGANKKILCPFHKEDNASCSVNVVEGLYVCFTCKAQGGVMDYLQNYRDLSRTEAVEIMKGQGYSTARIARDEQKADEKNRLAEGKPKHWRDIPGTLQAGGRETHRRTAEYDYKTEDGTLYCKRVRFDDSHEQKDKEGKRKKEYRAFTPCQAGGWWMCEPQNAPGEDKNPGKAPLYRLPELLALLKEFDNQTVPEGKEPAVPQVWIVEGEKCVEAVINAYKDYNQNNPKTPMAAVCTTSISRASRGAMERTDWEPVRGRMVALLADRDESGRKWVRTLAPILAKDYNCQVRMLLPDGEGGYDVADAIAGIEDDEQKTRTGLDGLTYWITKKAGGLEDYDGSTDLPAESPGADVNLAENEYFKVLGLTEDDERPQAVFQTYPHHNRRYIPLSQLTSIESLSNIAPHEWWEKVSPAGTGKGHLRKIKDVIRETAEQIGKVDLTGCLGRGAKIDGDAFYYNKGDKVLTEDSEGLLTVEKDFKDVPTIEFETRVPMILTYAEHAQDVCRALYDAVIRYRFRTKNEAHAFLGWIVTSLIGGALDFRPHIWIVGKTGVGKSFLLYNILNPMLGDALCRTADPTQAGIVQRIKADALAIYIDEFEPTQKSKTETEAILHTCRTATSGETERLRGSPSGRSVPGYIQRFSACMSSVLQPPLSDADKSRFQMIGFGPELPKDEWPRVEQAIAQAASNANGRILRHHVITHAKQIVNDLYRPAIEKFKQRGTYTTRMQKCCGALTAGVQFLSGDDTLLVVPTTEEDTRLEGEFRPLQTVLNKEITFLGNGQQRKQPIWRVLQEAYFEDGRWIDAPEGRPHDHVQALENHGIQMAKVGNGFELRLFTTDMGLSTLLRGSPYQDTDLGRALKDMGGITFPCDERGRRIRKFCGGQRRAYAAVSGTVLENNLGFLFDYSQQEKEELDEHADRQRDAAETPPADEPGDEAAGP